MVAPSITNHVVYKAAEGMIEVRVIKKKSSLSPYRYIIFTVIIKVTALLNIKIIIIIRFNNTDHVKQLGSKKQNLSWSHIA
jgi:hypothetical protein